MSPNTGPPDVFPSVSRVFAVGGDKRNDHRLYDVKFYPFRTRDDVPMFAVCGVQETFICRIRNVQDIELSWMKDSHKGAEYNSLVWMKDPVTRKPLICITGKTPKQIQVIDVDSGEVVRTLAGHGQGINDLAASPLSSSLLFSAAEDYTIRLWNLEPKYEEQPCVAVFAGEGHKQPILAMNVHPNGRWMLSGGLDTSVCLWAIPSPAELTRETADPVHQNPKTIYYPHFYSTEVHYNYVDCIVFYGDLIISRASKDATALGNENAILLWKIDGFDSNLPPPTEPPVPSTGKWTRSSFPHSAKSGGFQRLLTFDMPQTNLFYQRFGLLDTPGMRPILVMGNEKSKYHFWDLQRLEEGVNEESKTKKPRARKQVNGTKVIASGVERLGIDRVTGLKRQNSDALSDGHQASPTPSNGAQMKYDLATEFAPLKAHKVITPHTNLTNQHFATKSIAFSPDGTWMVGVGDNGMVAVFHRDKSVVWSSPPGPPNGTEIT